MTLHTPEHPLCPSFFFLDIRSCLSDFLQYFLFLIPYFFRLPIPSFLFPSLSLPSPFLLSSLFDSIFETGGCGPYPRVPSPFSFFFIRLWVSAPFPVNEADSKAVAGATAADTAQHQHKKQ